MAKAKPPLTLEQLQDKLAIWQQRMNLLHWEIRLEPERTPETEIALAEIVCSPQYDRAAILLREDWHTWDPAGIGDEMKVTVDYLIAHELAHAWMRDLDKIPLDDVEGMIHRDAHAIVIEGYSRGRERLVDHVARSLVEGWGPA